MDRLPNNVRAMARCFREGKGYFIILDVWKSGQNFICFDRQCCTFISQITTYPRERSEVYASFPFLYRGIPCDI